MQNTKIETLILSDNNLGNNQKDYENFINNIIQNKIIKTLEISKNILSKSEKHLFNLIINNSTITDLSLCNNNIIINKTFINYFVNSQNKSLRILAFRENIIEDLSDLNKLKLDCKLNCLIDFSECRKIIILENQDHIDDLEETKSSLNSTKKSIPSNK